MLHGTTYATKKAVKRALIVAKVTEAYALYAEGKLKLLARDQTLFTRFTAEHRLQGDTDTLLCWLRSVEIALLAYERRQAAASKQAAAFFHPFRVLGQRKLLEGRASTSSQHDRNSLDFAPPRSDPFAPVLHSSREEAQLTQEVSPITQRQYRSRNNPQQEVEGLSATVLSSIFDLSSESTETPLKDDDSIVAVGPFGSIPLIQQEFSSDSSYLLSNHRDVALSFDTYTHSSHTSATPQGYRSERRHQQIERIDNLSQYIDGINNASANKQGSMSTEESSTSFVKPNMTFISGPMILEAEAVSTGGDHSISSDNLLSDSSTKSTSGDSLWSRSSDRRLLRFPLHRIIDAPIPTEVTTGAISGSQGSCIALNLGSTQGEDTSGDQSSVDSTMTGQLLHSVPKRSDIVIEEISVASRNPTAAAQLNNDIPYLQLAQDTADSVSIGTASVASAKVMAFNQWQDGLERFTFSPTSSDTTTAGPEDMTSSESTRRQQLEIVSTTSGSISTDSAGSAGFAWRTLPFAPPQADGFDTDSVPSLVDGDILESLSDTQGDIEERSGVSEEITEIWQVGDSEQRFTTAAGVVLPPIREEVNVSNLAHGMVQGMAISLWEYVLSLQQLHSDDQDISGQQTNDGSYQSEPAPSVASSLEYFPSDSGDTEASTTSYVSAISVIEVDTGVRLRSMLGTRIPYKEQDDPPEAEG